MGTDGEVIALSLRERAEFAAIFDRHFVEVHRFFQWRAGREAADELAGETFRVAFEQRGRYDVGRADCLPWLFGIAHNLLRRHRRGWLRHQRALSRTPMLTMTDGFVDEVVARVDAATHADQLRVVLDAMSDGERDVLLLVAWEGLSYEEVAEALDLPIGTVRSRLHRGRQKLRDQLQLAPARKDLS